jgi:hypothetical protein
MYDIAFVLIDPNLLHSRLLCSIILPRVQMSPIGTGEGLGTARTVWMCPVHRVSRLAR